VLFFILGRRNLVTCTIYTIVFFFLHFSITKKAALLRILVSLSAGPREKEKKKRKRLFFEDFISKRKETQKKGERFQKKLYEYIAPKNKKNVITDHILRHAYHDTSKREKKRKNINNVIVNHIVKHMYSGLQEDLEQMFSLYTRLVQLLSKEYYTI